MLPSVVKDFRNVESKIEHLASLLGPLIETVPRKSHYKDNCELNSQNKMTFFSSNPPHRTAFWIVYEGSQALLIAQVGASPLSKTLLGRN